LRDGPTETSRARGVPQLCQAHSLRLDRSRRRLSPNPIRSSTFCRKLAWMHGWRCHPPDVSDKQIQCTSSPKANHASVTRQGRFRHPSAKKDTIRRTQGAFHQQISLIEACSAPCSTLLPGRNRDTSCAFSILVQSSTLTEGRSTKTRPSRACRHECRTSHKTAAPLPTSASNGRTPRAAWLV